LSRFVLDCQKMDFENSNCDSVSVEFDFRGDEAPTAMDPYRNDVISDRQQSILNELRINLCQEDYIYINNHKEVSIDHIILSILYACIGCKCKEPIGSEFIFNHIMLNYILSCYIILI